MIVFNINGSDVLVGRRNGQLFSCNNSCPHRGASLSKGYSMVIILFAICMDTNTMYLQES